MRMIGAHLRVAVVLLLAVSTWAGMTEALLGVPSELNMRFDYDVVFSSSPLTSREMLQIPPGRMYPMRQANGSSYLCELPPTEEELIAEGMNEYREKAGQGENLGPFQPGDAVPPAVAHVVESAIASSGQIISRKDYWTYVLSLGKFVRQEHQYRTQVQNTEASKTELKVFFQDVHFLGVEAHEWARTYMADSTDEAIVALREGRTTYTMQRDHEGAYLSSFYTKGDPCDLTGGLRHAEVQLRCLERGDLETNTVMDIHEVGTCAYVVKLYDRRACVPGILARPSRRLSIVCHPVEVERDGGDGGVGDDDDDL